MIAVLQIIDCLERKLTMVKKVGIPVGSYDEIRDAAGKVKLKPKRKKLPPQVKYAMANKKKFKRGKRV